MTDVNNPLNNAHSMGIMLNGIGRHPTAIRSKQNMVSHMTHTEKDLKKLRVTQLRKLAREHVSAGAWTVSAHKDELIEAILSGHRPQRREGDDEGMPPRLTTAFQMLAEELAKAFLREIRRQSK